MKKVFFSSFLIFFIWPSFVYSQDQLKGISSTPISVIGITANSSQRSLRKRLKEYFNIQNIKTLPKIYYSYCSTCGPEKLDEQEINTGTLLSIMLETSRKDVGLFDWRKKNYVLVSGLLDKPLYLDLNLIASPKEILKAYTKKYGEPKVLGTNPIAYSWKYGKDCFTLIGKKVVIFFGDNVLKYFRILKERDQETYLRFGLAWIENGEYDKAVNNFNKAITLNPQLAVAYLNRGLVWMKKGEYDSAICDFDKAVGLNPRYAEAYLHRGHAWNKKGEYLNAIDSFNKSAVLINKGYIALEH